MMKPNAATLLNDTKILGINSIRSAVYVLHVRMTKLWSTNTVSYIPITTYYR